MYLKNWLNPLELNLSVNDKIDLRRQALADNLRRGRMLAFVTIAFEAIFAAIDLSALLLKVHDEFHYQTYLALYGSMILANLLLLWFAREWQQHESFSTAKIKRLENILLAYIVFNMTWGSIVTLLDQKLYGQLTVFMVNIIFCSVVFVFDSRHMLIPFLTASGVLLLGLPFSQISSNILIGHCVNLSVFIGIAWLCSRLLYQSYCRNLANKLALERTNQLLAAESARNQLINDKLNQANFQLRQLSLIDELTGIANRRGLRNFISQVFEQNEAMVNNLAAIMIDIDHFKLYNDTYGHFAGDQVLVAIAELLNSVAQPPFEIVARWGGEEFILLSFAADRQTLDSKADAIRSQVEELAFTCENTHLRKMITVSIGTSLMPVSMPSDVSKVIKEADTAMYSAKRAGRNRVWSYISE